MTNLASKLLMIALTVSASTCYAGADQVKDSTTCYVFKQGKLVTKSKCTYHANVGAASDIYAINEYYTKPRKYSIIAT